MTGSYEASITWRLGPSGETLPTRVEAARRLYGSCVFGATAKMSIETIAADAVPDKAFEACRTLEPILSSEFTRASPTGMTTAVALITLKQQLRPAIIVEVEEMRRWLPPV